MVRIRVFIETLLVFGSPAAYGFKERAERKRMHAQYGRQFKSQRGGKLSAGKGEVRLT
jgi:hypothetical protein